MNYLKSAHSLNGTVQICIYKPDEYFSTDRLQHLEDESEKQTSFGSELSYIPCDL